MKRLLICLLIFISFVKDDCKAQVIVQDSLALLSFYNSIVGYYAPDEGPPIYYGNGPVSSWQGVSVSNSRVTGIDLSNIGVYLTGSISPVIAELDALQTLNLRNDSYLTDSIPAAIGNLPNLQYLDLSEIYNLKITNILNYLIADTSLTYIDLTNDNNLNAPIPASIDNLKHLSYLSLYGCGLTGSIPSTIGNLTNLTGLDLSLNESLTGIIPSSIGNLTNLTALRLDIDNLVGRIPPSIGNLTKLTDLELYYNQLTDSIPSSIGNLTKLQKLWLSNNQLSFFIPASIGNLKNLNTLDLHNNQLTAPLPASFTNMDSLNYVDLSVNKISGTIPFSYFTGFAVNAYLNLSKNLFIGTIPSSIANLTNISSLLLSNNSLTGNMPSSVSPNLKYLDLSYNRLSGTVPASISNLSTFTSVNISYNGFTFDGMEAFSQVPYTATYAPQSGNTVSISYNNFKLSATAGGTLANNIYKWYNNSVLAFVTYGDSTYIPTQTGNYTVSVTNLIATNLTLTSGSTAVNAVAIQVCPSGSQVVSDVTGTTYQWQVNIDNNGFTNLNDNSNYSGTHTNTLSFINLPTAWYGYQYRCLVDNSDTSTPISIQFVNTWTGADGNSLWEDTNNWSCGVIPDGNTDVVINSGTIVVSSNASVRSLTLAPGVSFTVAPGFNLIITH